MLLKVGFNCLLLWSQYLRDKVGKKESLHYIGGWQPGRGQNRVQRWMIPPTTIGGQEPLKGNFRVYGWREGATSRNSTVSSDRHLERGQLFLSLWSWIHQALDCSPCNGLINIVLIILSTVNLQFQGWLVPISVRPVLGTVAVWQYGYSLVFMQLTSSTWCGFQHL